VLLRVSRLHSRGTLVPMGQAGASPAGRAKKPQIWGSGFGAPSSFVPERVLGTVRGQLPTGHFGQFRNALVKRRL
jgi:hypothetical protein